MVVLTQCIKGQAFLMFIIFVNVIKDSLAAGYLSNLIEIPDRILMVGGSGLNLG